MEPVRFEDLAFRFELGAVPGELRLDAFNRGFRAIPGRDEVRFWVDGDLVVTLERLAGQGIEGDELVHLVPEELDSKRRVLV